jgi:hypothetical protein
MASETITYDKADLRAITRAFKAMDDEAATQAKEKSGALVEFLRGKIISAAGGLKNNKAATRIAQGSKVAKSSKIGEINLGYASQKFTGGGTTQINQGTEGGIGILAEPNLDLINLSNFPFGQEEEKTGALKVGLFIQLLAKSNLT